MSRYKETYAEQIERLRPHLEDRILGGIAVIEEDNFRFEVWAYRELSEAEMVREYHSWRSGQDRRKRFRGKTIRVITNFGKDIR